MPLTAEDARKRDENDVLAPFRSQFYFPESPAEDCIYFTGNSLGLQPKSVREAISVELDDWAKYGVEGHFEAQNPWYSYHELLMAPAAKMVGAEPHEVVHMNGLTANIHLLMVSFYKPTSQRYKIICEAKAFPSDQYALESQVRFHGFDPSDAIIEVTPRDGEHTIKMEDIEAAIEANADSLALVFWGGVNYYTGQFFDIAQITSAGHAAGAMVGIDLAHGAGNVPLKLHDWEVDFAAWCTYKYFNWAPDRYLEFSSMKNTPAERSYIDLPDGGAIPRKTVLKWSPDSKPFPPPKVGSSVMPQSLPWLRTSLHCVCSKRQAWIGSVPKV